MDVREPLVFLAIEPETKADSEKLHQGLRKLMEEDPSLRVSEDQQTARTTIHGMGDLHLEIIVDRLKREFDVHAAVGKLQVAYKVRPTRPAAGEGRYIKQIGGHGHYGHVKIRLLPGEPGTGYLFENRMGDWVIPEKFIQAIEEGIRDGLNLGVLSGYPVDDVRIELYDGSFHEVDSSDLAFRMAGTMAFQDAARKAEPVVLEPVMRVEVVAPKERCGDVIADLSQRRGRVQSHEDRGDRQVISGRVPLAEMLGYAKDLRSLTQGRASYSLQFDRYEPVADGPDPEGDRGAPVAAPRSPAPKRGSSGMHSPQPNDR